MSARRLRWTLSVLLASATVGVTAAAMSATATAGSAHGSKRSGQPKHPSIRRFDLNGYVLVTSYSLGRNKGNTFQQTYTHSTAQGVPVKGPFVGTTFPPEDYVAMPIGNHELYVAWLNQATHALDDVFVMNFATHVVFDYAPGSTHPESSGKVRVKKRGAQPLP